MLDTSLFEKALKFALKAHQGQTRKRSNTPYLLHPMEAATIVSTITEDQEVIAAALLHDTVEDTDVTIEQIEEEFGLRIKSLIASETEDKMDHLSPSFSWKLRKEESLRILKDAEDIGIKILWLGDKLSNMRSFYRLYKEQGNELWNRFNQKDPKEQKWYYTSIEEALCDLEGTAALQEYSMLLAMVFKDVE